MRICNDSNNYDHRISSHFDYGIVVTKIPMYELEAALTQ